MREELRDRHTAEEICADHDARRPPRREHDQRERDPAASRHHPFDPHWRVKHGEKRTAQSGERAAEQRREPADANHRVADRVGRIGGLADRAQHQARAAAKQEPAHGREHRPRHVDKVVLAEEDRSEQRQIAEQRQAGRAFAQQRHALERLADERGKTEAEQSQREARGYLIRHQVQREHRENRGHRRARGHACHRAEPQIARGHGGREAGDRADQHHAFHAEVQHASFFGHELAERGEYERGAGGDRRRENRNETVDHDVAPSGATGAGADARTSFSW